jgi:hypothetical protein
MAEEPECTNGSPMSNCTGQVMVEARLAQSMGTAESSGVSVLSPNILDPPPECSTAGTIRRGERGRGWATKAPGAERAFVQHGKLAGIGIRCEWTGGCSRSAADVRGE